MKRIHLAAAASPDVVRLERGFNIARPSGPTDIAPKWNQLFEIGTFHRGDFPNGKLQFTREYLKTILDNWVEGGRMAKPIDMLHRGGSVNDGLSAEEKGAKGWIEDLQLRADGLWGLIQWNAKGLNFILGDEYRYFSPTFSLNAVSTRTGKPQGPTLSGGALLNDPFLEGLPRVAASAVVDPPAQPPPAIEAKESIMDKKLILALLTKAGITLAAEATDAEVLTALAECGDAKVSLAKLSLEKDEAVKLAATNGSGLDALKVQLAKESAAVVALGAEVTKMKDAARDGEINALQAELLRDGKITSVEQDDVKKVALAMGIAEAKSIFSKRAPVVKFAAQGHTGANAEDPNVKLEAIAADIELKEKVKPSQAMRLAASRNPELYKASKVHGATVRAAQDA